MQKIIVLENTTLKDCLDASCPLASFAFSRLLKDRDIKVNGERVQKNIAVKKGDCITVFLTTKEQNRHFYDIVYEDDDFLVVDKASGVASEGLFCHLQQSIPALYFIHRLDRNTCGLLLFAKSKAAESALLLAFQKKQIKKVYHAIVVNSQLQPERAILKGYLKKDAKKAMVQIFSTQRQGAVEIVTEYSVLQRFNGYAKVKIVLHTGRTHQIRAHFASIGHPIAGDEKYGDRSFNQKYHIKRQILVAKELTLHLAAFKNMQNRVFTSQYNAEILEKS